MDNLEKYIFDPKNPQKCRVYNLLLHIVKKKENLAFISPTFFFYIFEKHFDFIKKELWDPIPNYDELNPVERARLYIQQYSMKELYQGIQKNEFKTSLIFKMFNQFIHTNIDDNYTGIRTSAEQYIDMVGFSVQNPVSVSHSLNFPIFSINCVFFIDSDTINLIHAVKMNVSSVIIAALDIFHEDMLKMQNTHPLILQDIKDVHLLLEILHRDMQKDKHISSALASQEIPYLKSLTISNYFCLKNISVNDLQDKKEIYVVGENGDGKTLFLQAALLALKGNEDIGIVSDFIKTEKNNISLQYQDSMGKIRTFDPQKRQEDGLANIFAYGVSRHQNDSDKKDECGYLTLFDSSRYLNNPAKWLQYLDYKKSKGEEDSISLEIAKEMLRDILDENIEIEVGPDRVVFHERGTEVRFSQLSDGYKNVMIWICDLLERLSVNQPEVTHLKDFRGIVLVDEIDLHLHPRWKFRIVRKLRSWFPLIQFIFTTHSPTVILGSSEDAVFFKVYKEKGIVRMTSPMKNIKNQMANTILTSPLFNLDQAAAVNSDPEHADTSEDFLYSVIHKETEKRVKNDKSISDDDILGKVMEELDKYERANDQSE